MIFGGLSKVIGFYDLIMACRCYNTAHGRTEIHIIPFLQKGPSYGELVQSHKYPLRFSTHLPPLLQMLP